MCEAELENQSNLISIIGEINKVDDSESNQLNMSASQTETCVFCNKKIREQKKVINHIELVHDSQTETCTLCEEKLKKTEKFINHVKCVHYRELGDSAKKATTDSSGETDLVECTSCQKNSKDKKN